MDFQGQINEASTAGTATTPFYLFCILFSSYRENIKSGLSGTCGTRYHLFHLIWSLKEDSSEVCE